jgi:hypothetical protein
MAKQTFTTGQVLTAAQMTSLQQTAMLGGAASAKTASYTLVAADAGTAISMSNASATTITVNTGLFAAGDTVQITNLGAGVCTITAGTATVNSSASLALAQYESGTLDFTSTSAAIFIKGAGASASSSGPAFAAYRNTSSQSITQNTWTKVELNAELFDTDNCYDPTTNYRFTPNKAGYYQVNARLNLTNDTATSVVQLTLRKNGSAYAVLYRLSGQSNTAVGVSGSTLIYLNGTTDYIELYINMAAATTRTVNDDIESLFTAVWIRS